MNYVARPRTLVAFVLAALASAALAAPGCAPLPGGSNNPPGTMNRHPGSDGGTPDPTEDPPAGSHCGRAGRSGTTDCPFNDCSAGQYCTTDSRGSSICSSGCVSDENCGANEYCDHTDSAEGRCLSCRGVTTGPEMSACVDLQRTGITECPYHDCNAGTYCDSTSTAGYDCATGCLSDVNCGPTEYCRRDNGSALGYCQPCSPIVPPDNGCTALVARAIECGAIPAGARAPRLEACNQFDELRADLQACFDRAGSDCAAVRACFSSSDGGTPDPQVSECQAACRSLGDACAAAHQSLQFGPTEVTDCVEACAGNTPVVLECVNASVRLVASSSFQACASGSECAWR